jgi:hypothetical protein
LYGLPARRIRPQEDEEDKEDEEKMRKTRRTKEDKEGTTRIMPEKDDRTS